MTAALGLEAREAILRYLQEDIGRGDVTTHAVVPEEALASAKLVAREQLVVAGLVLASIVWAEPDQRIVLEPLARDGDLVEAGALLARVSGPARPILTGERLALNLVQRLSGVATLTRRYADSVSGTGPAITDTRKTTPGLRVFEKCAVEVGGGKNHRRGLDDGVLIKDNHIATAGGILAAVRAARERAGHLLRIEVEVDTISELREALAVGAEAILLDNMSPEEVRKAVKIVREAPPRLRHHRRGVRADRAR